MSADQHDVFDPEPVQDMADVFEEYADVGSSTEMNLRQQQELFRQIKDVCNAYEIEDREDRIELVIAGLEHFFDRTKQQSVSDFRQILEVMQL